MTARGMTRLGATAAIVAAMSAESLWAQTVIPTRYIADRFYAAPITMQGDTLLMLMDTGGGNVFVTKRVLERMGITPKFMMLAENDTVWDGGAFPHARPAAPAAGHRALRATAAPAAASSAGTRARPRP